jgi:hypothetical protein
LLDDRIIGRGYVIFDSVNRLKWTFCFGGDAIIRFVVRVKAAV